MTTEAGQVQVSVADLQEAQVILSVPGVQGPVGQNLPSGGTTNQVLFKQSNANFDTAWGAVTSAMIGDLQIVNADVNASAAIAGTKISPNFGSQNVVTTGTSTAASLIPTGSSVPTNGLYLPAANTVGLATNSGERLRITSTGLVGIGTSSPGDLLTVSTAGGNHRLRIERSGTTISTGQDCGGIAFYTNDSDNPNLKTWDVFQVSRGSIGLTDLYINEGSANRFLIQHSTGNVGIGTTSPYGLLTVSTGNNTDSGEVYIGLGGSTEASSRVAKIIKNTSFPRELTIQAGNSTETPDIVFKGNATTERARIDSSGRFLAGTSSYRSVGSPFTPAGQFYNEGAGAGHYEVLVGVHNRDALNGPVISLGKSRGSTVGSNTIVQNNDELGSIAFSGADGTDLQTQAASIVALVDGTPGANDMPGRLVFSTTADGASSPTPRMTIDSSGRLLVGTSTSRSTADAERRLQIEGTNAGDTGLSIIRNPGTNAASGPVLVLARSRGTTAGSATVVASGDTLGYLTFAGADGTDLNSIAAWITCEVDGAPGADDMPGRLVFSTTADGGSSPAERLRICEDGTQAYNQPAPVAVNTTATLTIANLKAGIITSTTASAVTMTLPTGTLTEGGFSGLYSNFTFEWSVINTGANAVTVQGDTGHTLVGSGAVAANTSGRFASRRTAANTFVTYRLG